MSLATKVHSSFWSDDEIGNLNPEEKLAILWMLTNRETSNLGLLRLSKRQFEFDTGAPCKTLEGACKALARGFIWKESEECVSVLALNYIWYQFSDAVMNPKNLMYRHLVNQMTAAPDWVVEALLLRYKGLARGFYEVKPLEGAYKGDTRDKRREEKRGEEQSREEQSREGVRGRGENSPAPTVQASGYAVVPSDEEVIRFALTWPGEPASGASQMPEDFVRDWLCRMNGRTVGWPANWERALVADWRSKFRGWGKNGALKNGRPPGVLDLKTTLAAVQEQIAKHPANEDSAAHFGACSAAEEADYARLLRERQELQTKLSGGAA